MRRSHLHPDDETREWAALYAAGALDAEEQAKFEAHVRDGCPVCAREVRSFEEIAVRLGLAAGEEAPPAGLRNRVLARATGAERKPGVLLDRAGLFMTRSSELRWRPGLYPGVDARILFRDAERRLITALVRLEPRAVYPGHRHNEVESLFVLEGDLEVEGVVMRPGDYCRGETGSIHGDSHTTGGCIFLVTFSEHDERISPER